MPSRPIILPVLKKDVEPTDRVNSITTNQGRRPSPIKPKRNRRRKRRDRRQDVRNGVIVSLSFKNDRRKKRDRRRV
ncbi:hypothetical protein [Desulforapulum autotrophicum]|uniref:hypothetical protein n=1 Tax=Desulforapulum autotrophicum TaxID=2296 RepID=UPI000308256A|nr:hypothetical protein [Desulforapulum autotrophicum]